MPNNQTAAIKPCPVCGLDFVQTRNWTWFFRPSAYHDYYHPPSRCHLSGMRLSVPVSTKKEA